MIRLSATLGAVLLATSAASSVEAAISPSFALQMTALGTTPAVAQARAVLAERLDALAAGEAEAGMEGGLAQWGNWNNWNNWPNQ